MRDFTSDWFTARIPDWEELVVPVLQKSKDPCYLEIGSYEGRSACWVAERVPSVHAVCVDVWMWKDRETRFDKNTEGLPIRKFKQPSMRFLAEAISSDAKFDVIYVDGDHEGKAALRDAAMAWPLLRKGGVLVFDDYPWQFEKDAPSWKLPPKPGIDAFLKLWADEIEVLRINWQVYLRKIK